MCDYSINCDEPRLTREEIKAQSLAYANAQAAGKDVAPLIPKAQYINVTPPAKVLDRD